MLEEVLKHRTVERAVLVEIDAAVIDFSKQHLRSICGDAFDDPRTEVVIDDGVNFVAATDERFDVIISDSTDPIGPGEVLYTERYYAACKRCLTPGGVLVTQNGVPFMQADELRGTVRLLKKHFADASCYLANVPIYACGAMAFGWATDDRELRRKPLATLPDSFAKADIATRRHHPAVHSGTFALPPYPPHLVPSK